MSTYRAKKRGSLLVDGVYIPFTPGTNVTALAGQIGEKTIQGLIAQNIWEDVTVEIKQEQLKIEEQLKKVERAKKAKAKK